MPVKKSTGSLLLLNKVALIFCLRHNNKSMGLILNFALFISLNFVCIYLFPCIGIYILEGINLMLVGLMRYHRPCSYDNRTERVCLPNLRP